MPIVTVIIPTYNRAAFLPETLASVLRQTVAPVMEVLVVDDGSTDETAEVLRPYGAAVRVVQQPNRGQGAARNRGIAEASGRWLAFLDSDDLWEPTKLEVQLAYIEAHPDVMAVHTAYAELIEGTRHAMAASEAWNTSRVTMEDLLLAKEWVLPSSLMVRSDVPVRFREGVPCSEDIIYVMEILCRGGQLGYVPEPLVLYRIHEQMTNTLKANAIGASQQWRWLLETFGDDPTQLQALRWLFLRRMLTYMEQAKWTRQWERYWLWRNWLSEHWPADLERQASLNDRIYPPTIYRLKDRLGRRR